MPINDLSDILLTVPVGVAVELREGPGGSTLVCRKATTDGAGRPTRAALEDQNASALERVAVARGRPMNPEREARPPPAYGWPEEIVLARLPSGWRYRIDQAEDGAGIVLKGIRTVAGARSPSQVRRCVSRGLAR